MKLKKFFGIDSSDYKFEFGDVSTIITILNVLFIILGYWWAPWLGIINCMLNIAIALPKQYHINFYITQLALVALNAFFLI